MITALLLVFAILCIHAWQTPTIVFKGAHSPSLYTDINDTTHIIFCESSTNTLAYTNISSIGVQNSITLIGGKTGCTTNGSLINGDSATYTLHLAVVYTASRENEDGQCNSSDLSGCLGIWFIESFNNGGSWTVPILISSPNDAVNRHSPQILTFPNSEEIQVLYALNWQSIGVVLRSAKSTSWTSEILLDIGVQNLLYPSIDYTLPSNEIIYHLLFLNNSEELVYMRKGLNDTNWSSKVLVSDPSINQYNLIADQEDNEGIYIAYSRSGVNPCMVMNSTNNGKSFSSPSNVSSQEGNFISIAFRSGDSIGVRGGVELIYDLPGQLEWETFEVNWNPGLSPSTSISNPTHAQLSSGALVLATVFTDSTFSVIYFNYQKKLV